MKPPDVGTFTIDRFECDGRVFILNAPIECNCSRLLDIERQKDIWCYLYEPMNLTGYEYDRQKAWEIFNEGFAFDWDEIAQEDDSKLAPDAIRLKRQLLVMVKTVEHPG